MILSRLELEKHSHQKCTLPIKLKNLDRYTLGCNACKKSFSLINSINFSRAPWFEQRLLSLKLNVFPS